MRKSHRQQLRSGAWVITARRHHRHGGGHGAGRHLDRSGSALRRRRAASAPLTLFDTTEFKVHFGGQVHDWDPAARFGVKEARHLDRFAQFAMAAASRPSPTPASTSRRLPPTQCGVIIGSGIGGLNEFETQHSDDDAQGPVADQPVHDPQADGQRRQRPGLDPLGPSRAELGRRHRLRLGRQRDRRRLQAHPDGQADVMITGGSEAAITHMGLGGFAAMRALSTRNDDPPRASRPFDRDRDGFVLAEGAGILILEAEEIARRRGRQDLRRAARLRHVGRRLAHHRPR